MVAVLSRPRKTEYEIETKETMQREQKVIVLRTKEYCTYCVKNEGGVSLVRVRRGCEMQGKCTCEHRKWAEKRVWTVTA